MAPLSPPPVSSGSAKRKSNGSILKYIFLLEKNPSFRVTMNMVACKGVLMSPQTWFRNNLALLAWLLILHPSQVQNFPFPPKAPNVQRLFPRLRLPATIVNSNCRLRMVPAVTYSIVNSYLVTTKRYSSQRHRFANFGVNFHFVTVSRSTLVEFHQGIAHISVSVQQ